MTTEGTERFRVAQAVRQEKAPPGPQPALSAVTPSRGRFHGPARDASPYLSASFAACLNIFTNISRVSLPVAVFWFDGWYDASNTLPSGIW